MLGKHFRGIPATIFPSRIQAPNNWQQVREGQGSVRQAAGQTGRNQAGNKVELMLV
jgi:hypothetical protein